MRKQRLHATEAHLQTTQQLDIFEKHRNQRFAVIDRVQHFATAVLRSDRRARDEEQHVRRTVQRVLDLFQPDRAGADPAVLPPLDAVLFQPAEVRRDLRLVVVGVADKDVGSGLIDSFMVCAGSQRSGSTN